jgi:hypothetical protein
MEFYVHVFNSLTAYLQELIQAAIDKPAGTEQIAPAG